MRTYAKIAAAMVMTLSTANVAAAPLATGELVPRAKVKSLGGVVLDTHALNGKTVVLFYEDKDSTKTNQHVKRALELQKVHGRQATSVSVYGIANVASYDWFPANKFVKRAIRKEERKHRQPIFLDWSGKFARALQFRDEGSNVLVIGRDGRILLAHTGRADDDLVARISGGHAPTSATAATAGDDNAATTAVDTVVEAVPPVLVPLDHITARLVADATTTVNSENLQPLAAAQI